MRYARLLPPGLPALLALAVVAAGISFQFAPATSSADPEKTGYPNSIAATGDSITQATNSDAIGDQPHNSWSTGTSSSVQSIYFRILQLNPLISGNNYNDAVSGARMVDLDGQVTIVNGRGVDLVTILMGANDVCTSSEASMTPVTTFRTQFEQAMATLSAGSPDARIAVASIPDIHNLWVILKDNPSARFMWSTFSICQSLLANPLSTAQEDIDRRNNVRQRNIDFNAALQDVCSQYIHCRFDDNATFNLAFQPADVSSIDYFHPSVTGLAMGASAGWNSIYDFTDSVAPASIATTTPVGGGMSVAIAATDDVAVAGVEYKINGGAYQRYDAAVTVVDGDTITYRAVDVNGNIEASHDLTACTATGWPVPVGDRDCDGFTDAEEAFVGTDPNDACPDNEDDDAWPADLTTIAQEGKHDGTTDIFDIVLLTPPVFGKCDGAPEYDVRKDFDRFGAPPDCIDIFDIVRLTPPMFGQSCTP